MGTVSDFDFTGQIAAKCGKQPVDKYTVFILFTRLKNENVI